MQEGNVLGASRDRYGVSNSIRTKRNDRCAVQLSPAPAHLVDMGRGKIDRFDLPASCRFKRIRLTQSKHEMNSLGRVLQVLVRTFGPIVLDSFRDVHFGLRERLNVLGQEQVVLQIGSDEMLDSRSIGCQFLQCVERSRVQWTRRDEPDRSIFQRDGSLLNAYIPSRRSGEVSHGYTVGHYCLILFPS